MTTIRKPPLPPDWEKRSALEKRAYQLEQGRVDERMVRLLKNLPAATEQNRQAIMARVDALSEHEREAFDRISSNLVEAGIGKDHLRALKGL